MSDEYQLRKDIDRLISDVYNLESGALQLTTLEEFNELSELVKDTSSLTILETSLENFEEDLSKYNDELESFSEQLTDYRGELDGFSGQLSNYAGQLTTFSGQLSSYGGQLTNFSGQLSGFDTTLTGFNTTLNGYKSRLDDFDDALNDESTGFITTLSTLKTYIYGYDPNNPSAHDYNNPTSDSLKGMTNTLQQLVRDLQTGDGIVLENLGRLKSHIQAFSGNLQQFKAYLAQQGVDISTLNDDVISLILELNKSLDTISEHQDMLEEAQEIIGEPSTQSTQATGIFKRLEDGEEVIGNVSTQADAIDVIVRGDPQVQGDTGLQGATSDLQDAVGDANSGLIKDTNALKNTVGDSSSGLIKDTNALKNTVGDSTTGLVKETNALKTTVGNENSGLVKKTNDLDSAVGDENTGLIAQTNDIIDTIGEPSVGQQSATGLHLLIDNAQSTADGVNGVATLIKQKIGYESIETPLQTQITAHDGDISDIQGDIGTVPTGQTLQGQIDDLKQDIITITSIVISDYYDTGITPPNGDFFIGTTIGIVFNAKINGANPSYGDTITAKLITPNSSLDENITFTFNGTDFGVEEYYLEYTGLYQLIIGDNIYSFTCAYDTGWLDLDLNEDEFEEYVGDSDYSPMYRIKDNVVYLRGAVRNKTAQTFNQNVIAILPYAQQNPYMDIDVDYPVYWIQQGTNAYRFLLSVKLVDGYPCLVIDRYTNSSTTRMECSSGSWLNIGGSFIKPMDDV